MQASGTDDAGHYDLVILDAPASGHALAILRSPRTFGAVARAGPIARQARAIDAMLCNPARTGVVLVARPEEMPVNETLALARPAQRGRSRVDLVVANGVLPNRFSARDGGRSPPRRRRRRSTRRWPPTRAPAPSRPSSRACAATCRRRW